MQNIYLSIHICAVQIHLTTMAMNYLTYLSGTQIHNTQPSIVLLCVIDRGVRWRSGR